MGNKSGVLVAKIFLWMLEMLLKWAPKINSFPGKAFRVTQLEVKQPSPIRAVTKSLHQLQCSRWGAKQPGSFFWSHFLLCPMKIAQGHAHNK